MAQLKYSINGEEDSNVSQATGYVKDKNLFVFIENIAGTGDVNGSIIIKLGRALSIDGTAYELDDTSVDSKITVATISLNDYGLVNTEPDPVF